MTYKKGILAGLLIGIGGFAYLSSPIKEIGAFLFALGLLGVIIFGCSLYTGKIGYIESIKQLPVCALICAENFLGAIFCGILSSEFIKKNAAKVVSAKLALSFPQIFIKAFFCGITIYLAVELYRIEKNIFLVIMAIMIFILCGFEHCVANAFYFAAAGTFSFKALLLILTCIIGNALGSLFIKFLNDFEI